MKAFSSRIKELVPSASMAMAERVQKAKETQTVLDLTWGQPDFDTPEHIKQAAYDAIRSGKNGYTPSAGIADLRQAISDFYMSHYKTFYNPQSEILVTPGAKQGLMYIMQLFLDPGDEVLLFEPCWLSYRDMILLNQGVPRTIPAGANLVPDVQSLEYALSPRTKAILINNPVNPTGYVFDEDALRYLVDIAVRHDLYLIADEIYDRLVFRPFTSLSVFKDVRERLVVVNGFSKTYAMTGWRIGYLLASKEILSKVSLIHQHTATCASAPSQYGALAALRGSQKVVSDMCNTYRERRDFMVDNMNDKDFSLISPGGTFYAMLDVSTLCAEPGENAEELLRIYGIATVEGNSYGNSVKHCVRLSLTKDIDELAQVVSRLEG